MSRFLLSIVLAFILASASHAGSGRLRVLYLGQNGTPAPKHCALLMRELGRDAI